MRTRLFAALAVATLCFTVSVASAQPAGDPYVFTPGAKPGDMQAATPMQSLVFLLSGFHGAPAIEELQTLPFDLQVALPLLADNPEAPVMARARAVTLLEAYPTAATRSFVDAFLAADAGGDLVLLGRTVQLVGALGDTDPAWAMGHLRPLASHDDPIIREFVVRGLGHMRELPDQRPSVDELLLQLVVAERSPAVTGALREVLANEATLTPSGRTAIQRAVARP